MVLFHLCYDLKFLAGVSLPWFAPPFQDVWRASISWTFLVVAGCMCPLSRSNLKRACQYGAVAVAIFAVTSLAAVDTPISFGIIYCMAACTLVAWAFQRLGILPHGYVAAGMLLVGFLALQGLARGSLGLGPLQAEVPRFLYDSGLLAWLGLPGPAFSSGDYYPLLPYLLLFLAGAALGTSWKERGYPGWALRVHVPGLTLVGQHALVVYVAHQPVLLAIAYLAAAVTS